MPRSVPADPKTVNQHPTEFLPPLTKRFDSDSVMTAVDRLFDLYVDAWRPWDAESESQAVCAGLFLLIMMIQL